MKRRLVIVLVIFVATFSLTTGFTYGGSPDGTTYQRGWPVGYYHDAASSDNVPVADSLCGGADLIDGSGGTSCLAARGSTISDARIAMGAVVWLAISSVAAFGAYFVHQRLNRPRS